MTTTTNIPAGYPRFFPTNSVNYTARYLAAAQCIVIGPVCGFVTAGGRAVSEPYYSQRAQCLRLSERFFHC